MGERSLTFAQAINEAMHLAMEKDPEVLCYGLGVDDPKRIFGTTKGLQEAFGEERVFDMPTSENGMLGIGIGAALNDMKPVMVHQRLDFFLLAMDQLVNAAAKWFYMFGGQRSVPITIRLMLGRGWGQGPTHSQNLQAWFAHIPGLKVVMPATAADAKGLLLASIFDPNPVVFLEHRWLHHQEGNVPAGWQDDVLGKAKVLRTGTDITLVAISYQVVEALRAAEVLQSVGISAEVIDLRTVQPIDWATIEASIAKTGRVLALDTGALTCSVSAEIVARSAEKQFAQLKTAPARIAMPDFPEPTSYGLTKSFHPDARNIVTQACKMCCVTEIEKALNSLTVPEHHDVPGEWFKGPF